MLLRSLILLATLSPFAAITSDLADEGSCRNGAFPSEQSGFALAKVVGAPRLYLLGDMDGCPAKGEPACRQRSYVVSGDTLVTGRDLGSYRCAFFPNKVGGSAGWVDRSKLQALPVRTPSLQDWVGDWKDGDNGLRISVQGGQLHVQGDAYWPSANPTPEQRPYGPNIGQVDARATPRGADVEFVEDTCRVRVHSLGEVLIVADNSECGGMNVRFNGVYRRAGKR
ncbi:hypothetical protein N7676_11505 [Stenotrophomonas sp. GD03993]|uniref:hypothetical protein n=1 Tax=unclassified Stenotrophomonas TaxID=196198 RepID=UPI00130F9F85|nr:MULTISPECIES: hypothetical protein [Stenotrophomonas]MBH1460560.1 hypothetical protein [Stenotrophomonas maltophilia]MDH0188843.1 hypothetical protein [Stenotrophomonas sp. GD04051]MDH0464436.1 hypothetical protein [Stenotrophomonas sp. GD03993]MDH0874354.1 hypothetical protein [Stenotrophomonas sp. GD03877]MDH2158362.1 hypothetical protein [Stenotrophomonas sp. GD03657]